MIARLPTAMNNHASVTVNNQVFIFGKETFKWKRNTAVWNILLIFYIWKLSFYTTVKTLRISFRASTYWLYKWNNGKHFQVDFTKMAYNQKRSWCTTRRITFGKSWGTWGTPGLCTPSLSYQISIVSVLVGHLQPDGRIVLCTLYIQDDTDMYEKYFCLDEVFANKFCKNCL